MFSFSSLKLSVTYDYFTINEHRLKYLKTSFIAKTIQLLYSIYKPTSSLLILIFERTNSSLQLVGTLLTALRVLTIFGIENLLSRPELEPDAPFPVAFPEYVPFEKVSWLLELSLMS